MALIDYANLLLKFSLQKMSNPIYYPWLLNIEASKIWAEDGGEQFENILDDEADSGRAQETGEEETYSFSAAN